MQLPLGVADERYDHILLHYLTIEHVNRSAIVVLLPFLQQVIHCLERTAAESTLVAAYAKCCLRRLLLDNDGSLSKRLHGKQVSYKEGKRAKYKPSANFTIPEDV